MFVFLTPYIYPFIYVCVSGSIVVVTLKVLAYTSSITTRLQSRGFDIVKAYEEIHLVITTLEKMRNKVDEFHHDCFVYAKELAIKVDVEVKKPCTCQRQRFRLNAVGTVRTLMTFQRVT